MAVICGRSGALKRGRKPGARPALGTVRWTIRLEASNGLDETKLGTIPSSHGVVCVLGRGGAVVAMASTGDMRSFAAQRLGPAAEGVSDLRESAEVCECAPAGSMFEADLMFMDAASERDPGLHDRVTRKLRVWWLATSRAASGFEWSWTTNPAEFAGGKAPGAGAVIGPFLEKSGAKRHAAFLDGHFELCRYPEELHKAPGGKACVYKQMGKCPAACDGSESIGAYEARLGRALGYGREEAEAEVSRLEDELRAAVGRQAFEEAASIQGQRDELAAELKKGLRAVRGLGEVSVVAVATSGEKDAASVLAVDRGRWAVVGAIEAGIGASGAGRIAELARERLDAMSAMDDLGDLGVLGVVSRELMRPSRGGPMVVERGEVDGETLLHAAERVLRIRAPKSRGS